MKKIIIVLVVLAAAAVAYVALSGRDDDANTNRQTTQQESETAPTPRADTKTACQLLTLADAKSLIGENAVLLEGSGSDNAASTESVTVDNCSYSADGETLGDMKQLALQVHYGDAAQVRQGFENYKEEYPGEALTGLGDEAYFATETKQVNILKDGVWLFVGGGSINAGDEGNKDLAINAARRAVEKL